MPDMGMFGAQTPLAASCQHGFHIEDIPAKVEKHTGAHFRGRRFEAKVIFPSMIP